jgi:hypothetical protein
MSEVRLTFMGPQAPVHGARQVAASGGLFIEEAAQDQPDLGPRVVQYGSAAST